MRALVVEDDPDVRRDVADALTEIGFVVDQTAEGDDAWFRGDVEDYDVAVVDLGLPRLDGLSVVKRWRSAGRTLPVLILSARADWTEKVEGIEAGGDDYLAKPFKMGELITRVRALVRRTAGHASAVIVAGGLRIDTRARAVWVDDVPVTLSLLEFRLLHYIAHQPGRPVSAGELADHLYGTDETGDSNAIEALIMRVRKKIGSVRIKTRRGFGYTLVVPGA